jgi:signal transduction histidine kinase
MLHFCSVITHGGNTLSFNYSRAALAWSAIAIAYAVLAMMNLASFGSQSFYFVLGLRLFVCLLALAVTLWSMGELPLAIGNIRALFAGVVALELFVSLHNGKLSGILLFLGVIAVASVLNEMRDRRLAFETIGRGLKPAIRRQRDLINELRENAARLKETLRPTLEFTSSAHSHLGESMFAHEGSLAQPVTKSNGPVQGLESLTQLCSSVVESKRAKYLGRRRAHLVLTASRKFEIPVQVMIEADDLQKIVGTCIDYAVNSLSGGEGVVRLNLSTGLRHVTLSIEDNGYGISEERLSAADTDEKMSFAKIRGLAAFWGARLVRNARLGVGSRVTLEFPRVDAFVSEGRAHEAQTAVKRSTDLELPLG